MFYVSHSITINNRQFTSLFIIKILVYISWKVNSKQYVDKLWSVVLLAPGLDARVEDEGVAGLLRVTPPVALLRGPGHSAARGVGYNVDM